MAKVQTEVYCRECGHSEYLDHNEYECPKCGSQDVFNGSVITCECGEIIPGGSFTNECPNCGRMYNAFGQELAPVDEWDPDDAYGTFGPQDELY